jgi:hypothetical protein
MKEKQVKVTAYCSGVAPRERKIKTHKQVLGYLKQENAADVSQETIVEYKEKAKAWSSKFKLCQQLLIKLMEVEIDYLVVNYGTGEKVQTESYMMFNSNNKTIEVDL